MLCGGRGAQGAAEAGEQLGEDRFDDRPALLVEGSAVGGAQLGGHGLPAGLAAGGVAAGLRRFAGDGDMHERAPGETARSPAWPTHSAQTGYSAKHP